MRKNFLLFVFFVMGSAGEAQKNNWRTHKLSGKVKSVIETGYIPVVLNNKIESGTLTAKSYNAFDEAGNATEYINYDTKGKVTSTIILAYDSLSNLISENQYEPSGKLRYRYVYKYDSLGNQVEELRFKSNAYWETKWIRVYDKNNFLIEEDVYGPDGILRVKRTYKNDSRGNRIEGNGYKANGSPQPGAKFSNKYDDKSNLVEESVYSVNGSLEVTFLFKYDDKGNLIELKQEPPNSIGQCTAYIYEFDAKGNWTRQIEFKEDKPFAIRVREIKYYQ